MPTVLLSKFADVFRSEVASINKRRGTRPHVALEPEPFPTSDNTEVLRPTQASDVIGVALSGGGERSAAFCLGALQALHEAGVLPRADYLSTVSGGGYIGSSVSASMTANGGQFPFKSVLSEDETPSLQHVRNYSNYLFPEGVVDLLRNSAIYARGLVANAILILFFLLIFAAVTVFSNPTVPSLTTPDFFGLDVSRYNYLPLKSFAITAHLGLLLLLWVIVWGVIQSRRPKPVEIPNTWTTATGVFVIGVLLVGFFELQPFVLLAMFEPGGGSEPINVIGNWIARWLQWVTAALAPIAAAATFLARKLGEFVKSSAESSGKLGQFKGIAGKIVIYIAALFVPLLLWLAYLRISYWGICATATVVCDIPLWLQTAIGWIELPRAAVIFYVLAAVVLLLVIFQLRPNANSLHPLYRDRLSKAFLFVPRDFLPPDQELQPLRLKLSELSEENAPYHLINTALNVQASKTVNRRGRNADFLVFSRNFIGSKTTDYVATPDMERVMTGLDLGTAMAASGAAASSNMGAASIKPLTPTLAMLNVRLGYWMRNPRRVGAGGGWNALANFYFLWEMFGQLDEKKKSIYVTDGGHIENLGIYELLRRRCKVIIAIDGEADSEMAFGSLNTLERYALIDLGVRIVLPWQGVSDVAKETSKAIADKGDCQKRHGPHVAIGEIGYPGDRVGVLIYIKASMTGDENDYVFHYKKRYPAFPHETTLDQLFSEEQFEAYRALGFHAAYRFFNREDRFAHLDPAASPCFREHIQALDNLFPAPNADRCWPRKHDTFADWYDDPALAAAKPAGVGR